MIRWIHDYQRQRGNAILSGMHKDHELWKFYCSVLEDSWWSFASGELKFFTKWSIKESAVHIQYIERIAEMKSRDILPASSIVLCTNRPRVLLRDGKTRESLDVTQYCTQMMAINEGPGPTFRQIQEELRIAPIPSRICDTIIMGYLPMHNGLTLADLRLTVKLLFSKDGSGIPDRYNFKFGLTLELFPDHADIIVLD